MKHFNIHASKDGKTEIDIFGQIGDSFFEEGNTLENIKAQIEDIDTELVINVASLGGNVFEGLAIHDLIANHKAKTTTNIVGTTASAGAVIADGSDEVNITENSLFLIHNSRGGVLGTAKEMEEMAEDMKKIDNRMAAIFAKKTGKTEKKIKDLMDEDKFLDAKETKEFGFADKITKPKKIAATVDYDKIMASKELSKEQKDQLNPKIESKPTIMDLTPITALITELKETVINLITSSKDENKDIKILDNKEYQDKINEIEKSIEALNEENTSLAKENEIQKAGAGTFEAEKATLKAEKETLEEDKQKLQDEVNRLKGTSTTPKPSEDEEPDEDLESTEGSFGRMLKAKAKAHMRL